MVTKICCGRCTVEEDEATSALYACTLGRSPRPGVPTRSVAPICLIGFSPDAMPLSDSNSGQRSDMEGEDPGSENDAPLSYSVYSNQDTIQQNETTSGIFNCPRYRSILIGRAT